MSGSVPLIYTTIGKYYCSTNVRIFIAFLLADTRKMQSLSDIQLAVPEQVNIHI